MKKTLTLVFAAALLPMAAVAQQAIVNTPGYTHISPGHVPGYPVYPDLPAARSEASPGHVPELELRRGAPDMGWWEGHEWKGWSGPHARWVRCARPGGWCVMPR